MHPPVGAEAGWMRQNLLEFNKRAEAGDKHMELLIEDIKTRKVYEDLAKGE